MGGDEGSKGSKGLGLARRILTFGDGGWRSENVEGYDEERFGCLWTVLFLLTCSHLFFRSSLFSFSFFFVHLFAKSLYS